MARGGIRGAETLIRMPREKQRKMRKKSIVVSVTRVIAAKPREVFEAWLDPNHPASPWLRRNGVTRFITDLGVGGLYYLNTNRWGRDFPHFGRYLRLDKPGRIEYTWASESTYGAETLIKITLKPTREGTRISLRHSGLPNDERGRGHQEGWDHFVGALAEGFGTRKR
jgi:uncharacterized protein YndB with AHSA1/START domain